MQWPILLAVVVAFAAGVGVGVAMMLRRSVRLRRVSEGVAELARGNLGHRIILAGGDDIGRVAEGINALADAVQEEREAAGVRDESQRRLLANISHDLRTPIASIAGYVDALQRGLGDDPDRYLAIIAAKTEELVELTDDLFYEARLDSGDLELKGGRLDFAEAVRRAILGFEQQFAGRDVTVEADIPEVACPVQADASAVARILGNLISNAFRHGAGMTTFRVAMGEDDGRYVVRLENDGAVLPGDVERLFERGAGGGGGAGLGLAIARELAGRMGATVSVQRIGADSVAFSLAVPKDLAAS
ncbi:MAG TPA: HAMP domain-containing sensor histidine kinase [Coriobacteriia bacterium]|nr:HAMP domain-containing sensor histidine kinase [Coriobacteriia bacterium]